MTPTPADELAITRENALLAFGAIAASTITTAYISTDEYLTAAVAMAVAIVLAVILWANSDTGGDA